MHGQTQIGDSKGVEEITMDGHHKEKSAYLQNVNLTDIDGTMDFYRQVIEGFINGHAVSESDMRAIVYALRGYLDYLKHKDDLRIEERLEAIEELYEKERKR